MDKIIKLLNSNGAGIVGFVLGGFVATVLLPSKTTIETMEKKHKLEIHELQKKNETLNEVLVKQENRHVEYQEETTGKIDKLIVENSRLRQSVKKRKFKLIKPDGTIIEKEYEESETEQATQVVTQVRQEFDRKVKSIENKWVKIHKERVVLIKQEYEKKLREAKEEKKSKETKVNEKKIIVEVGVEKDKELYIHSIYNLWGPFIIGSGSSIDANTKTIEDLRIGVGINF